MDVAPMADNQTPTVSNPRESSFEFPAFAIATQGSAILLCRRALAAPVDADTLVNGCKDALKRLRQTDILL